MDARDYEKKAEDIARKIRDRLGELIANEDDRDEVIMMVDQMLDCVEDVRIEARSEGMAEGAINEIDSHYFIRETNERLG